MLFNSYEFIFCFLPITLIIYYALTKKASYKASKYFLILASVAFYSYWDIRNLSILLVSIAVNFFVGRRIVETKKKTWLITGIAFNLGEVKISLKGDISGQGEIGVGDLSLMQQQLVDEISLKDEFLNAADMDTNYKIDVIDMSMLQDYITKK